MCNQKKNRERENENNAGKISKEPLENKYSLNAHFEIWLSLPSCLCELIIVMLLDIQCDM